jgi:hypothetical protein
MDCRRRSRLTALFLTAVFIGSGFALPDLDALLHHSSTVQASAEVGHVDLPGGCGTHSEQCALTLAAPLPQVAPGTSVVRSLSLAPAQSTIVSVITPPSTYPRLLHPSRAPPASAS